MASKAKTLCAVLHGKKDLRLVSCGSHEPRAPTVTATTLAGGERNGYRARKRRFARNTLRTTHSPPLSSEVLLAIQYVGICGSDVHFWVDGHIGDFTLSSPIVMGHEPSALVVAVGDSVSSLQPGMFNLISWM